MRRHWDDRQAEVSKIVVVQNQIPITQVESSFTFSTFTYYLLPRLKAFLPFPKVVLEKVSTMTENLHHPSRPYNVESTEATVRL